MFTQEDVARGGESDKYPSLPGNVLLREQVCRQAIDTLREIIPLSKSDFDQFYLATIDRFSEYVQSLPATRQAFYANAYGLLQLSLDRSIISVRLALKGFEELEDLKAEELSAINQAELFAIFASTLLSDLGLLPLRFAIQITSKGKITRPYDPYAGSMYQPDGFFSFKFNDEELGDWPAPASLVLAQQVLKTTSQNYHDSAFAWLSQHHGVLQFWYSLMLQYPPANEDATRRRFLASLLPNADHDLIEKFLDEHFPYREGIISNKRKSLFNVSDEDERAVNLLGSEIDAEAYRKQLEKKADEKEFAAEFEQVFLSIGPTDASNSRAVGSLSSHMSPLLRFGFAYVRWLMLLAKNGRLGNMGSQAFLFRTGNGEVVLDWQKSLQAFAKDIGGLPLQATELLKALRQTHLLKESQLLLKQFMVRNARFAGLALPEKLIFGNYALPPVTLGIAEASSATAVDAPKQSILANNRAMFNKKPQL